MRSEADEAVRLCHLWQHPAPIEPLANGVDEEARGGRDTLGSAPMQADAAERRSDHPTVSSFDEIGASAPFGFGRSCPTPAIAQADSQPLRRGDQS